MAAAAIQCPIEARRSWLFATVPATFTVAQSQKGQEPVLNWERMNMVLQSLPVMDRMAQSPDLRSLLSEVLPSCPACVLLVTDGALGCMQTMAAELYMHV